MPWRPVTDRQSDNRLEFWKALLDKLPEIIDGMLKIFSAAGVFTVSDKSGKQIFRVDFSPAEDPKPED